MKAATRVEQVMKLEKDRKQQNRPHDSQPERGRKSRSGFQRQRGIESNVSAGSSLVPTPAICEHCGRNHEGICRRVTGTCFKCGATDHQRRNCPMTRTARTQTRAGNASGIQTVHRPHPGEQTQ